MPWYQPLPSAIFWSLAAAAVLASAHVLVFLARHPVDGESRIVDWSERNRVPLMVSGSVLVFAVLPNPVVLAAILGLYLWLEHTERSMGEHRSTSPRASAQYY